MFYEQIWGDIDRVGSIYVYPGPVSIIDDSNLFTDDKIRNDKIKITTTTLTTTLHDTCQQQQGFFPFRVP